MTDAFFAGRVFVPMERDGYRFFLWGEGPAMPGQPGQMSFTSTFAEPAAGAFLCQIELGWIFVAGAGEHNHFRHTFTDITPQAEANAQAMHGLGIQILTREDGNAQLKRDGVAMYSITDDEKRRQNAPAKRNKQGRQG